MEIVVMINGQYKILNMNLHEYIDLKYKDDNKFMIYPVTEKAYEIMKQQIKDGYLNKRSSEEIIEQDKLRYMIVYNPEKNNIVVDNYNIPVESIDNYLIGSYVVDADGFHHSDEDKDRKIEEFCGTKIYTTERYEDVIVHYYYKYMDIKFKKITEKIFTKEGELTDQEIEFFKKCITNQNCVNSCDENNKVKTIVKNN